MTFSFWCVPCGCSHSYELHEAPGRCPRQGPSGSLTREQAKAVAANAMRLAPVECGALVDALAALGVLKLDERMPKQVIKDTLAGIILQAREADPKAGGWRITLRDMILKALEDAGFYIGKQEVLYPRRGQAAREVGLGRCGSGPLPTRGSASPISVRMISRAPPSLRGRHPTSSVMRKFCAGVVGALIRRGKIDPGLPPAAPTPTAPPIWVRTISRGPSRRGLRRGQVGCDGVRRLAGHGCGRRSAGRTARWPVCFPGNPTVCYRPMPRRYRLGARDYGVGGGNRNDRKSSTDCARLAAGWRTDVR
jgi:hypothetical protein